MNQTLPENITPKKFVIPHLTGKLKTIHIVIFSTVSVVLVLSAVVFYFVGFNQKSTSAGRENNQIPADYLLNTPTGTPTETPVPTSELGLFYSNQYLNSGYRIVTKVINTQGLYDLLVLTKKSDFDNTKCGGMYTSPVCYFIRQPKYQASATLPEAYLGKWESQTLDSMTVSSLRFIDPNTVEFQSFGVDDNLTSKATVRINILTGAVTEISRE